MTRRVVLTLAVACGPITGAVAGDLGVDVTEIARTGDGPPERPGETFTTFSDPSINGDGLVTFKGNFDGPLSGNEGIYLFRDGTLTRIVDDSFDFNPPGQGGATSWSAFGPAVINGPGQVVFRGNFSFGDNSQGLYLFSGRGAGDVIFDDNPLQPVPGQPAAIGFSVFPISAGLLPLANDAGTGVCVATFVDGGFVERDGVYVGDVAGGIARAADETMTPPGQAGAARFSTFDWFMVLGGGGHAAFHATYTGGTGSTGVFIYDPNDAILRTVADGQTTPPDQPGTATFFTIENFPGINDAARVAFAANFIGGAGNKGIFAGDGVGPLTTIVDNSGRFPVPGHPGLNWFGFGPPVINGPGAVAYAGEYGPGADQRGIYLVTDGTVRKIVDFADDVPGQPGAAFFAAGSIILNTHGHVTFTGRYGGGVGDEGIYFHDGTTLHRVVDESQPLFGQTISNFHMMLGIGGSGGQDGKPRTMNDAPQIAFRASLAGGGEAVYRVDLTLPCPADLDGSGATDVDDLVTVIRTWGPCPPSSCAGDVTGDGRVNVDDLVAVIAAWGACPQG